MSKFKQKFISWVKERSQPVEPVTSNMEDRLQEKLTRAIKMRNHNITMAKYWSGVITVLGIKEKGSLSEESYIETISRLERPITLDNVNITITKEDGSTQEVSTLEALQELFYNAFLGEFEL